jgi:hypothetical protein
MQPGISARDNHVATIHIAINVQIRSSSRILSKSSPKKSSRHFSDLSGETCQCRRQSPPVPLWHETQSDCFFENQSGLETINKAGTIMSNLKAQYIHHLPTSSKFFMDLPRLLPPSVAPSLASSLGYCTVA